MSGLPEYAGLFAAALLSATIFPFQSEIVLAGLLLTERHPWTALVAVASVGNVIGSIVNWFLGQFLAHFEGRRWFPVSRDAMARGEAWYHRYGRWTLLLSWMPVIGDPLTIVAGVMREPLPIFVALVAIAKTARYLAVAALTFGWL
ncbi:YqaA family protein [Microvirga pudoricolor]|uniref:YqaA family protein n=1 Tax=Microvirga pudoricolor TaxID=2778729 RepID=UPI00194FBD0B|nr:YqaA family protein [Microvirga pudoricolor]MBM6596346.1 DedA family protein [Microvirga pudoricolor]